MGLEVRWFFSESKMNFAIWMIQYVHVQENVKMCDTEKTYLVMKIKGDAILKLLMTLYSR